MSRQGLTAAIARDLLREPAKADEQIAKCLACGRGFVYRHPSGDDCGQFCSDRCRESYDAGAARYTELPSGMDAFAAHWRVAAGMHPGLMPRSMTPGSRGFLIDCAGCGRQFDSRGLRCCSAECERAYRERIDGKALMQEVQMEAPTKRNCAECNATIPRWRNGRRVPTTTRFCSDRCSTRARRRKYAGGLSPRGGFVAPNVKKVPANSGARSIVPLGIEER